ncbi:MAG: ABC transporter permease, partial [Acidobacteriia bacterium]|nr:ABC transporter permease [Terriglobia bacterium]
ARENRLRRSVAFLFAGSAAVCLLWGSSNAAFYSGYVLVIASLVLLSPALAVWLAHALRPLFRWLRPVEGALAADSLIQSPRRTSATVSALMLSLALAVGFAGVSGAIYKSVLDWMDNSLNPDLFVWPSEHITARNFRFPGSFEQELQQVPGIEDVQCVRNARVMVKGVPAMAVSIPIERVSKRVQPMVVEGSAEEMNRLATQGKGVILADNLAQMRNIHKGDVLELDAPGGRVRLPVLGTVIDYSDQQGSFLIDRSLYQRLWRDDTVNGCRVHVRKGASVDQVKETIQTRFSKHRRLFVFTNHAIRKYVLDTTAAWFGLTYVQLAVALVVAILGIVNTLTVSISDRRRELAVLQAVGGLRRQIRYTIWMEAVAIGLIGLILGLAMGAITLYYNLEMLRRDMAGLRLPFEYPFLFALALLPVIVGAAWVASLWPAESAVRASLVESLEYE